MDESNTLAAATSAAWTALQIVDPQAAAAASNAGHGAFAAGGATSEPPAVVPIVIRGPLNDRGQRLSKRNCIKALQDEIVKLQQSNANLKQENSQLVMDFEIQKISTKHWEDMFFQKQDAYNKLHDEFFAQVTDAAVRYKNMYDSAWDHYTEMQARWWEAANDNMELKQELFELKYK